VNQPNHTIATLNWEFAVAIVAGECIEVANALFTYGLGRTWLIVAGLIAYYKGYRKFSMKCCYGVIRVGFLLQVFKTATVLVWFDRAGHAREPGMW